MFAIFKKHTEGSTTETRYPVPRKAGVAYATREEAEASLAADPRESPMTHEVQPCVEAMDIYEDVFFYEVL